MVCKTTSFYRLKSIEDYSKEQETQQKELQEELETSKAQLVQLFQVCVDWCCTVMGKFHIASFFLTVFYNLFVYLS